MNLFQKSILEVESLGSNYELRNGLAGLHEARKEHLSQFFTPIELSSFVWNLLTPAMDSSLLEFPDRKISLFDNSVGSGRLFYFSDPEKHALSGVDLHADSIATLMDAAVEAGFDADMITSPMEGLYKTGNYSLGLINPPFSILLDDPDLTEYECNTHGTFGPNTRAKSHHYALHQALDCCGVVAAILPASMLDVIFDSKKLSGRCVAVYTLPATAFASEGANVKTIIAVFGDKSSQGFHVHNVDDLSGTYPSPNIEIKPGIRGGGLVVRGYDDSEPALTTPVTGDNTVRVTHNSRNIGLHFQCGMTEAKVLNAILQDYVVQPDGNRHRYPKGVKYQGQGKFDLESYLATDDPLKSFSDFVLLIEQNGGRAVIDTGLTNLLKRRINEINIELTPLRHTIFVQGNTVNEGADKVIGTAKVDQTASDSWGSPFIEKGQEIEFTLNAEGNYDFEITNKQFSLSVEAIRERFSLASGEALTDWKVIHEGRVHTFPERAAHIEARAKSLGIDQWLNWDYQWHDFIEMCISPKGVINSWEMGLGKARCAIALAMMGGKYNAIVVEPHLIDEMIIELKGLGLSQDLWGVIRSESDTHNLKKINLISYSRLRLPIKGKSERHTIARCLRRRLHTVVGDEGHLLRNTKTKQSRAMRMLSAKKRFILTGTPIANYPRDILPLIQFVGGDGTAAQPYGLYKPYMSPGNVVSMNYAVRGIDEFSDNHVTMEWVTNEFKEELQEGAKREVPVINNVVEFRDYVGKWIKRRLQQEPEVAKYVDVPVPTRIYHTLEWDYSHLAYYLTVCDDFNQWYKAYMEECRIKNKNPNLMLIVLRLQAIRRAANVPHSPMKGVNKAYGASTVKEDFAVNRLIELKEAGHKTILYSAFPDVLERLAKRLEDVTGTKPTLFHGDIPILKRTKALDDEFRHGESPWLLASFGVTQTGLNIPQADRVLMYDREWSATTEEQALKRVLRPQQQSDEVVFEYLHLEGSIDEYQHQMVEFKRDSAAVGLDWGESQVDSDDYQHVDTILGKFCDDMAALLGFENAFEAKDFLKKAA